MIRVERDTTHEDAYSQRQLNLIKDGAFDQYFLIVRCRLEDSRRSSIQQFSTEQPVTETTIKAIMNTNSISVMLRVVHRDRK